jgi:hypothetical protein
MWAEKYRRYAGECLNLLAVVTDQFRRRSAKHLHEHRQPAAPPAWYGMLTDDRYGRTGSHPDTPTIVATYHGRPRASRTA